MKNYRYKALEKDGTKIEGKYEADSKEEVLLMITSRGYYPIKVEEANDDVSINFKFVDKVKTKDLAIFCRQFHAMLDAGLSIIKAIDILSNEVSNKRLKRVLINIGDDVKKGQLLSESMEKHRDVFPKLLISMVESGEASGNLDEMMLRMSIHFEKENKINNKIKSAMTYPMVIGFVAIATVSFLLVFVMPTFITMFEEEGVQLPLITRILIGTSVFFRNNIILIIVFTVIIVVLLNKYFKTETGDIVLSSIKLKLPVLGNLNKKIIVSRFTRTLSTLLSSGVSLIQAIPIVSGVIENKVAENELLKVRERVVRGEGLSDQISESDIFPKMLSSMIKVGEESGSLDEILNKTADFYDEEVEQAIQKATSLVEPVLIVFMGLVIGSMILAIMLPMFDMYSQI